MDSLLVHDLVGDFLRGTLTKEERTHLCDSADVPDMSNHDCMMRALMYLAKTEKSLTLVEQGALQKVVRISLQAWFNPLRVSLAQGLVTTLLDRHANYRSKFVDLLHKELENFNDPVTQTTRRPPRTLEVLLEQYDTACGKASAVQSHNSFLQPSDSRRKHQH